ncbi:MAG: DUF1552 domain-containing protein [Oligoflexales bacterium]
MKTPKNSRRMFLKHTSGLVVGIPLLSSLFQKQAFAAAGGADRFVFLHSGHGQFADQWLPDPSSYNWAQNNTNERRVDLTDIAGPISQILGADFDSLRDKLTLLSRIDYSSDGPNHNPEALLTGGILGANNAEISIDHVIADKKYGKSPLNIIVNSHATANPSKFNCSVKNASYAQAYYSPAVIFNQVFQLNGTAAEKTPGAVISSNQQKKVIDFVLEEYKSLENNSRLSKADKERLQEHIQLLSEVEGKINDSISSPPPASCSNIQGPTSSPLNTGDSADYDIVLDQAFEILGIAVRCGQEPISTLMFHPYDYFQGNLDFLGLTGDFHTSVGHADEAQYKPQKLKLQQYYAQKIAKFLSELNTVENTTTGDTYLDNSIVFWGNDQGAADRPGYHSDLNLPIFIAGGKAAGLQTGQYIDYGTAMNGLVSANYPSAQFGRPLNQVLVTILQGMGLTPNEYEAPGGGFGHYGGRTAVFETNGADDHKTSPLPFLK